ncbi:ACBP-domain-containing protein [Rhodofomes roseus]|uniref:ACBP-domain-containing protein n=1 Tax=Rhodofomes roseus TaxID=34475 RepID=A0ABQ8KY45_9APHY|nr:ACBP-domain-containing protein [Rhodofomes roseus]KAH9843953.1 ACBP-domain-containing protein [Rhodofomes roseus]
MDSRELIDAQFDRAVEIVQGLPKNGPIQTGYEEKLTMYSLYKQATVGNVQSPRPSVWDMLGRAKWDAWAKHKDLDPYEAKWLYIEALLKVLRRYSDKTVAMDLVRELESYTGDPSNIVMSGSLSRSAGSSSSGSTISDDHPAAPYQPGALPAHLRNAQSAGLTVPGQMPDPRTDESSSEDGEEENDEVPPVPSVYAQSQMNRPQSSMSSRRYRTPMAGSTMISPPPVGMNIPAIQPLPEFQTESAFAGPSASSGYNQSLTSYRDRAPMTPPSDRTSEYHHPPVAYRPASQQQQRRPYASIPSVQPRPPSRPSLERAVEHVQATLVALTERIEALEAVARRSTTSFSLHGSSSPWASGQQTGVDLDDMGMWSLALHPLAHATTLARHLAAFLATSRGRSPTFIVVRRLFLDISFLLCLLALMKAAWRRSGMRRREVLAALAGLWRAIAGQSPPRRLVNRGV